MSRQRTKLNPIQVINLFLPAAPIRHLPTQMKVQLLHKPVGNVASTALSAAEEMILGAGGLINPQTHGNDYAEMAWQHRLRNQAKKKRKYSI